MVCGYTCNLLYDLIKDYPPPKAPQYNASEVHPRLNFVKSGRPSKEGDKTAFPCNVFWIQVFVEFLYEDYGEVISPAGGPARRNWVQARGEFRALYILRF